MHVILVVDDDQDIREVVGEILSGAGYGVVSASNGSEALEALTHMTPCMILLDLNMPVMDGLEFCRRQSADVVAARIPTVVMSAVHQMQERIAGLTVADALEKPIRLQQLLDVVERHCR